MPENRSLWYKDAIIYEVPVRAFFDSDGGGEGTLRGLTQKLDYVQDLGVTAIWLLPFYPSPLKDDGYDIADYTSIHPKYGKIEDFTGFLEAAHGRGIRVITELVLNHTSDQHPWFQRARHAPPGSREREFYVWSDNPEKYQEARVLFPDFEPSNWTWDPLAKAYFWHRFYSHQPDLNYDNPAVWEAMLPIVDFWFDLGVDGMRLDAVPYLYERENTNCENQPETHQFLKALRQHVDVRYPDRMFLAEANQWPEDAVAYFGEGDECQMAFHFPLMPRLFMALHQEDRFPIYEIMGQTPDIPEACQWCLFLRNHDELTLEMVTDEERDYMYRAYSQDRHARINLGIRHRLAPLLSNDRRRIELMFGLLFALPGTPVLYYGDEIGMGDNIYLGDRDGVRTPMQWSADRNAGFSRANPQMLYLPVIIDPQYHYETVNVEAHQSNPSSLLWWVKRLITIRKKFRAFGRGSFRMLRPDNSKVLVFIREDREERILIVANLSRFVQYVHLDLRDYAGVVPEEVFGQTRFPQVGDQPYFLSLGPHGYFWFSLAARPGATGVTAQSSDGSLAAVEPVLPELRLERPLSALFQPGSWDELEAFLPQYLDRNQILRARDPASTIAIVQIAPIPVDDVVVWMLVIQVEPPGGITDRFFLRLTLVPDDRIDQLLMPLAKTGLVRISGAEHGVLCDALAVPVCCRALLRGILSGRSRPVGEGQIEFTAIPGQAPTDLATLADLPMFVRRGEQMDTTVIYGDSFILKTFHRVDSGISPDLEIGRYLTEQTDYRGAAPVVGYIEYRQPRAEPVTIGVLHRYVANQGNAWQHTLDHLSQYFEHVAALSRDPPPPDLRLSSHSSAGPAGRDPGEVDDLIGGYLETARLLGRRTGELHLALASNRSDRGFAPVAFDRLYLRSVYQSMHSLTGRLCDRLARCRHDLPESARPLADAIIKERDVLLLRFRNILDLSSKGLRIRCHGNYSLGQLLHTGKDFVIMDFQGDASRTFSERRVKRSPLVDVASMVRSFDHAVSGVRLGLVRADGHPPGIIRPEDCCTLEPWADFWYHHIANSFISSYYEAMHGAGLLPPLETARDNLLGLHLFERVFLEIDAALLERQDWAVVPLRAAVRMLGHDPAKPGLRL
jgi:maltose alpha-D-glucosyltransferase/alpha-amylase